MVHYTREEKGKLPCFLGDSITTVIIKMEIVRYLHTLKGLLV